MSNSDVLYAELKHEIGQVATALFEMSKKFLDELGNFLPHGAILTRDEEVKMVAADPGGEDNQATSVEVLPLLHDGLRFHALEVSAQAVGVAENVTITLEGGKPTRAVKVLFEHKRGLTVALYLPFRQKDSGGFVYGEIFSMLATPEVCPWSADAA